MLSSSSTTRTRGPALLSRSASGPSHRGVRPPPASSASSGLATALSEASQAGKGLGIAWQGAGDYWSWFRHATRTVVLVGVLARIPRDCDSREGGGALHGRGRSHHLGEYRRQTRRDVAHLSAPATAWNLQDNRMRRLSAPALTCEAFRTSQRGGAIQPE